ncbi:TPA: hypothetical protein ACP61A_004537 [Escherichia coli]|uniref:hypothetical protein n=1 Tax=Escherichia coli TaxID=562 RepID=UPI0021C1B962|nr:hypothetical protein [Escherichia coli]
MWDRHGVRLCTRRLHRGTRGRGQTGRSPERPERVRDHSGPRKCAEESPVMGG